MKSRLNNTPPIIEDKQQTAEDQNTSLNVSRRLFLRTAGLSSLGLALPWLGLAKSSALGELNFFARNQKHYYAHDAVLDRFGVIAPWYKHPNGQCDYRIRIAAETLKRYPWTTAENAIAVYPDYLFTSKWKISPDGTITTLDPGDWMNGDLGQRSTSVLKGMVEYYRYSGDPAAIAHMTYMGDLLLDHCLTPEDHAWPKFPISVPVKGKAYGKADPNGMIQLDICGSMAQGLLRAYQVTSNQRWYDALKHWGDLFAEKCNTDPTATPWPRYANPENIAEKWKNDPRANVQTGGVTMILAFLDELIRTGYTGKDHRIVKARDAGMRHLRDRLLPKWTENSTWALYFWDWLNFAQNCSTTGDVTSYMMNNKSDFPNWRNDVRNILSLFLNRSSASTKSNGDVYNGAWAYPESTNCCGRSLWYAPLLNGTVMAQYGCEAQDQWAREVGYRQLILQTYDVHENGVTEDNIDGGVIVNGNWLNIAHPWPLFWVLNAISWLPEELGASRENHLVRSNAVVNSIEYGKGKITYSTFDAPNKTIDVLRLSFKPKEITADGRGLHLKKNLEANGYTVRMLPNGDCIVQIRHDGAKDIIIHGSDPQTVIDHAALNYSGVWKKQDDQSSFSGFIHSADTQGASVTANFFGNQVRLIGRADTFGGLADVFIDEEKQIVPIDFYNPKLRNQQTLYYKNGLSQGAHIVRIVARGKGNHYSRGSAAYVDSIQFSAESGIHNFPSGTGPKATQRMIFGYTKRQDYKDKNGKLWRPGSELVSRSADPKFADLVEECWWKDGVDTISNTPDPELYRYGYHANEFWVNITVGPGKYDLRLKFAATRGFDSARNSFDVLVNGKVATANFDVKAAAGGLNKATDLLFKNITPLNGIIEIRLKAAEVNGEAFLQALEVGQNLKGNVKLH
jgi:hypothetical protein